MSEAAEERARVAEVKEPLEVRICGGRLEISIGLETLAFAMQNGCPRWPDNVKITDEEQFGRDVLHELLREEEDGTTLVHRMLDRAGINAMEQGSEGVEDQHPCAARCQYAHDIGMPEHRCGNGCMIDKEEHRA